MTKFYLFITTAAISIYLVSATITTLFLKFMPMVPHVG